MIKRRREKLTLLVISLFTCGLLIACGEFPNNEIEISPPLAQEKVFIEPDDLGDIPMIDDETDIEPETEPVQIQDTNTSYSDMVGYWTLYKKSDSKDNDIKLTEQCNSIIEIFNNNTFAWNAYGKLWGDLMFLDSNNFSGVNLFAMCDGAKWSPYDNSVKISYDPESGLLRLTCEHDTIACCHVANEKSFYFIKVEGPSECTHAIYDKFSGDWWFVEGGFGYSFNPDRTALMHFGATGVNGMEPPDALNSTYIIRHYIDDLYQVDFYVVGDINLHEKIYGEISRVKTFMFNINTDELILDPGRPLYRVETDER